MPVTARLSSKFYDAFGDEIAKELVGWFNEVDATYRADLRELNERNFSRFDAKLEQRAAELDAKIELVAGRLDAKIDLVAGRLDAKIEQRFAELESMIKQETAALRVEMGAFRAELLKWMFFFWAGSMGTVIALLKL